MNYSEWRTLGSDERRNVKWHQKPHIKTGTLFTVLLIICITLFVIRVGKNETSHLDKKPDANQAYYMAQGFVKDKLKLPASADFPKNRFESSIDAETDTYNLNGFVNVQNTDGQFQKQHWAATLKYTGGDWSERKSWQVEDVKIE